MKKIIFLLFPFILFFTNCGTTYFSHPTKTAADFNQDAIYCDNYAMGGASFIIPQQAPTYIYNQESGVIAPRPDFSGVARGMAFKKLKKNCLESLGWIPEKK